MGFPIKDLPPEMSSSGDLNPIHFPGMQRRRNSVNRQDQPSKGVQLDSHDVLMRILRSVESQGYIYISPAMSATLTKQDELEMMQRLQLMAQRVHTSADWVNGENVVKIWLEGRYSPSTQGLTREQYEQYIQAVSSQGKQVAQMEQFPGPVMSMAVQSSSKPIRVPPELLPSSDEQASSWKFLREWELRFAKIATRRPAGSIEVLDTIESEQYRAAMRRGWRRHLGVSVGQGTLEPEIGIDINDAAFNYYTNVLFHGGCAVKEPALHFSVRVDPDDRHLECRDSECNKPLWGDSHNEQHPLKIGNIEVGWRPPCKHIEEFLGDSRSVAAYEVFTNPDPQVSMTTDHLVVPVLNGLVELKLQLDLAASELFVSHEYAKDDKVSVRMKSLYGDTLRMAINTVLDKYRSGGAFLMRPADLHTTCKNAANHLESKWHRVLNVVMIAAFSDSDVDATASTSHLANAISFNQTGMCWTCALIKEYGVPLH